MCWTFPLAKFNQLNPHGNKTARGARENEPRELILTHTEGERKKIVCFKLITHVAFKGFVYGSKLDMRASMLRCCFWKE